MNTGASTHIRRLFALLIVALAAGAISGHATAGTAPPGGAYAYGWPVKPFFAQHPVRGYFGDPRIGKSLRTGQISHSFHFGVDVSAPDATAVYATISGRVVVPANHQETVEIRGGNGLVFSYWHIIPAVQTGDSVTAYRTVIGHIAPGWGHVHFAEVRGGGYVNPLRPGAMGPYVDDTTPSIGTVRLVKDGRTLEGNAAEGTVKLVVDAFDLPALAPPEPWHAAVVTPAVVRWRILDADWNVKSAWRTAFDVRLHLPHRSTYFSTYTEDTRQNRANTAGWYGFILAAAWSTDLLPDGRYAIQVEISDTGGHRVRSSKLVQIVNGR